MPDGDCPACERLGAELCAQCAAEILRVAHELGEASRDLSSERRTGGAPRRHPLQDDVDQAAREYRPMTMLHAEMQRQIRLPEGAHWWTT